jgi:hypothetical protein
LFWTTAEVSFSGDVKGRSVEGGLGRGFGFGFGGGAVCLRGGWKGRCVRDREREGGFGRTGKERGRERERFENVRDIFLCVLVFRRRERRKER